MSSPRSYRSSSASSFTHLLYLNDTERQIYLSNQPSPKHLRESISYFSFASSRTSSDSGRTSVSVISRSSTNPSSIISAKMSTPKYADDRYPLISSLDPASTLPNVPKNHSAVYIAREMACIHNTLIRALNSMYNHASSIEPATQRCQDFLAFSKVWLTTLHHHHEVEEEYMFPALEKLLGRPGAMESNVQGHESFMPGFLKFEEYVNNLDTFNNFDGQHFQKLIEAFAPDMIHHLHDEIVSLLGLYVADSKMVRRIWNHAGKLATKDADLYIAGPFLMGCQDNSFFIDGQPCTFPNIPWFVEAIVKRWHAKKHAGLWEFCPSDLSGNRRLL